MNAPGSMKVTVDGRKYHITGLRRTASYKNLLCALAKSKGYASSALVGDTATSSDREGENIVETLKRDCLRYGDTQSFNALNSLDQDVKIVYRQQDGNNDCHVNSNQKTKRRHRERRRRIRKKNKEANGDCMILLNGLEDEVSTSDKDTTISSRTCTRNTIKTKSYSAKKELGNSDDRCSPRKAYHRQKRTLDSDDSRNMSKILASSLDHQRAQQRNVLKRVWINELQRTSRVYYVDSEKSCRRVGFDLSSLKGLPECDRTNFDIACVGDRKGGSDEGDDSGLQSFDYDTSSVTDSQEAELDENANPLNKNASAKPQTTIKEVPTQVPKELNKSDRGNNSCVDQVRKGKTKVIEENETLVDNGRDAGGSLVSNKHLDNQNRPLCGKIEDNTSGDPITTSGCQSCYVDAEPENASAGIANEELNEYHETKCKHELSAISASGVIEWQRNRRQVDEEIEEDWSSLPAVDFSTSTSPVASVNDLRNTVINDVEIIVDTSSEFFGLHRNNSDLESRSSDEKMTVIDATFIARTAIKSKKTSTTSKPGGDAKKKLRKIDISQPTLLDPKRFKQFNEISLINAGRACAQEDQVDMATSERTDQTFRGAGKKLYSSFRRKKNSNDVEFTPTDKLPPLPNDCATLTTDTGLQNGCAAKDAAKNDKLISNGDVIMSPSEREKKQRGRSKSSNHKKDRVTSPTRVTSPIRKLSNMIRKNKKNENDCSAEEVSSSSANSSRVPSIRSSSEDCFSIGNESCQNEPPPDTTSTRTTLQITCGSKTESANANVTASSEDLECVNCAIIAPRESNDLSSDSLTINEDAVVQTISDSFCDKCDIDDFSNFVSPCVDKSLSSPEMEHTSVFDSSTHPEKSLQKCQISLNFVNNGTVVDETTIVPTPLGEFSNSSFGGTNTELSIEDLEAENDDALSFFDKLLADLNKLDFTPVQKTSPIQNSTPNLIECNGEVTPIESVVTPIKSNAIHSLSTKRTLFPDNCITALPNDCDIRNATHTHKHIEQGEVNLNQGAVQLLDVGDERDNLLREYSLMLGSIDDLQDRIDHVTSQLNNTQHDGSIASDDELTMEEEMVYKDVQSVKNLLESVIDLTSYQYQEITHNLQCMAELDEEIRTRLAQINSVQDVTYLRSRDDLSCVRQRRDNELTSLPSVPDRDSIPRSLLKRRGGGAMKERLKRKGWRDGQVDDGAMVGRYL